MPDTSTPTRRTVLATVGTGVIASGSVVAVGGNDDDDAGQKTKKKTEANGGEGDYQPPTEPKGPVFVRDNGYFFVFLDCSRFFVFGDLRSVDETRVLVTSYQTPKSPFEDDFFHYEPESSFLFGRDVADDFPTEPARTIASRVTLRERGGIVASATNPLQEECEL